MDLSRAADGLVGHKAALAVDEVRGEDCIDERRFTQAGLPNTNNIELETSLEQLFVYLLLYGVESAVKELLIDQK
jgi:hypothetical protein